MKCSENQNIISYMKHAETIRSNVRLTAAKFDLKQKDLAAILGISSARMGVRLRGKKEFLPSELEKIANHLGIDIMTFYKSEEEK